MGFIAQRQWSQGDTRLGADTLKQELATAARLEDGRRPVASTGGAALPLETDFELITRMPLTNICKLLSKIL
jgi:hypothetical protein